jgi:hypothetical protein
VTGSLADLLAGVIRDVALPEIAAVDVEPSGPDGWCRVRVRFADGAAAYIGVAG